jgi:hypothetical protein
VTLTAAGEPQVSAVSGVFFGMDGRRPESALQAALSMLVSVRCLECGEIYSKPADGGTAKQNPGCPNCGYVGWLRVSLPAHAPVARRHSGADPQPGQPAH